MSPGIARLQTRGANWLAERSPRERLLILGFALLAAAVLFVTVVWNPLETACATARDEIRTYDALVAQVSAAGPRLTAQGPRRNGPASAIITDTAAEAGLTIRRLEPDADRTRVSLEDADFEHVMRWLDAVERSGRLKIDDLKLERRPAPGVVNAQVMLVGR